MDATVLRGIRGIKPQFPGARFIVFGSRARGTAREDSDLDLYVVFPEIPQDPFSLIIEIRQALRREVDLALDVLVADEVFFRDRVAQPWSLECMVNAEGVAV